MSDVVLSERPSPEVAVLTLNRPEKKNALSIEVRDEVSGLLDELGADHELKVLVVTGAGDTFSAGFDLREFDHAFHDEGFAQRLWESSDRWHRTWLEFPVATIAAVNGAALAGGMDLAVMCDLRVASAGARFAHPEISFGDVVYGPLHDLVGGAFARDLVLTGREVHADEALRMGLVNRVVPDGTALEKALEMAEAVTAAPSEPLRRTKAKIQRRAGVEPGRTLDL